MGYDDSTASTQQQYMDSVQISQITPLRHVNLYFEKKGVCASLIICMLRNHTLHYRVCVCVCV